MLKIIVPSLLGVFCLYYIFIIFEWKQIWQILQTADIMTFIFSSIVTTLIFWLLRTLRWSILLQSENINISFGKLYLYTAVTVGFANFTPFQSGEALKVELSRKDGGNRVAGYKFFLFEKLLDLVIIAFLALLGVFVLFGSTVNNYLPQAIVGLIIISIILMIAVFFIFQKWQVESNLFPNSLVFFQKFFINFSFLGCNDFRLETNVSKYCNKSKFLANICYYCAYNYYWDSEFCAGRNRRDRN